MNRIVVGLSRSAASLQALKWAATRARDSRAELRVITAITDPLPVGALAGCPVPILAADVRRSRTAQWQHGVIEEVLAAMNGRPTVSTRVEVGSPARVLREHCDGADLLVLGATQRRFKRTVRRCMDTVRCPVVVIAWDQSGDERLVRS